MNTYYNRDIFPQNFNNENIEIQNRDYANIPKNIPPTIENILRTNKGKQAKIYMTFPYINEIKEFSGIIEQNGNDYIVLSEPRTGKWNLLPLIYLSYITFDENINYNN